MRLNVHVHAEDAGCTKHLVGSKTAQQLLRLKNRADAELKLGMVRVPTLSTVPEARLRMQIALQVLKPFGRGMPHRPLCGRAQGGTACATHAAKSSIACAPSVRPPSRSRAQQSRIACRSSSSSRQLVTQLPKCQTVQKLKRCIAQSRGGLDAAAAAAALVHLAKLDATVDTPSLASLLLQRLLESHDECSAR